MLLPYEERARLTKKRWMILFASCLINLVIGTMYAWSVFSGPMAEHLNRLNGTALTAADLSIVFSVGNADGFITQIAGGFLANKIGPKWVIFSGGIIFGLGFVVCGLARNIPTLIVGFGLMCGMGVGLAYGCTINNSVKFFPDKKGLVGGIATASYGISSVIVPPIANRLNDAVGVNYSFMIIGAATIVVVGIFSLFVEETPCPNGFAPIGWENPNRKKGAAGRKNGHEKNWKQMVSSPVFYVMLIMLFFGGSFGMMAISQASGMAQKMIGMTPAAAAVVVSILALFNAAGRIIAGVLSDKLGRINTLTMVYVIAMIALGLLYFCHEGTVLMFYVGICLIGVCFGSFMGIYPGFTSDNFGAKNSSVNYGIMFIGFCSSGLIAPLIISGIYKSTGAYQQAFLVAIGMAVAGLILSFVYRAMAKKNAE